MQAGGCPTCALSRFLYRGDENSDKKLQLAITSLVLCAMRNLMQSETQLPSDISNHTMIGVRFATHFARARGHVQLFWICKNTGAILPVPPL